MNIKNYLILLSIVLIYLVGCSNNPVSTDQNLLYSANELICDYHDSIMVPIGDTFDIVFKKSIVLKINQKTFSSVKFEGNLVSYFAHDSSGVYNPNITFGLMKDTNLVQINDTLTIFYRLYEYIGNFSVSDSIKYNSNELFNIVFYMSIRHAQRGDYIKVRDLKIYKID